MLTQQIVTSSRAHPQALRVVHESKKGGVDTGLFSPLDGSRPYHLVIALLPEARFDPTIWGEYGKHIGADSDWDGLSNTEAILKAERNNAIANHIRSLDIDGHRDFYWASKLETKHVFEAIGDVVYTFLPNGWAWSSTQYSANFAWNQNFSHGDTNYWAKDYKAGALAVRRFYPLILQ